MHTEYAGVKLAIWHTPSAKWQLVAGRVAGRRNTTTPIRRAEPLTFAAMSIPNPSEKRLRDDDRPAARALAALLFSSRWLQAPLYVGLIVAQLFYVYTFMKELWHIADHITEMSESEMMLMVLGLVDVVMVANLLIMVIVGGYETFVSRIDVDGHPDQPEWLSHVNANVLKVKLAMAIIGISSIHLLKAFVDAKQLFADNPEYAGELLMWQTLIHIAFILSAMALQWIDRSSNADKVAAAH